MSYLTFASHLCVFLLLCLTRISLCQEDIVVLKLADGSTSRPLRLLPLHEDKEPPPLVPIASPQLGLRQDEELQVKPQEEDKTGKRSTQDDSNGVAGKTDLENTTVTHLSTTKPLETIPSTTTTIRASTKSSTKSPSTTTMSVTTHLSSTNSFPSISTSTPPSACHQECRAALNATSLQPHTSLTLKQGSMLKLVCEVPLVTPLVLENLVWLYQSDDIAKGQCSLTTQEYIHLCKGFLNITHIMDRNDTFVRETIIVGNLQGNYSGQYMCQVQITCCPQSTEEHVMNHELSTRVTVWLTDYTIDLAITGSLAVGLVLILIAGSIYLARQNHGDYVAITDKTLDVKPMTVLHIPLVDDQDNDSFDSNFDEQE